MEQMDIIHDVKNHVDKNTLSVFLFDIIIYESEDGINIAMSDINEETVESVGRIL